MSSITNLIKSQKLDLINIEHGFYKRDSKIDQDLITIKQIHSSRVVFFDGKNLESEEGDAIVTTQKNYAIAVSTADCAPILLCDDQAGVIAAVHAGWRGAFADIVKNTIAYMKSAGANVKNIAAAVMPCIAQESYEVSEEFYDNFIIKDKNNKKYFIKGKERHYQFDLKAFVVEKLKEAGVQKIDVIDVDTFADKENCYSYRRCTLTDEEDKGRHLSFIKILD